MISRQFRLQAVYTNENFITNKSMQSILPTPDGPSLKYVLGCLNSSLVSWIFLQRSNVGHRDDFPKIVLKETRELPIAPATSKQQRELERFVDRILATKQGNPEADTRALERDIDQLVYGLYGLTPEEIKIVEGASNGKSEASKAGVLK